MMLAVVRASIILVLGMFASSSLALTPNLPRGDVGEGLVIRTSRGEVYGAVLSAPQPVLPSPRSLPAISRGLFVVEIGAASGIPYSVRMLQSTGNSPFDGVVINTLYNWRFRPRAAGKVYIPVNQGRLPSAR